MPGLRCKVLLFRASLAALIALVGFTGQAEQAGATVSPTLRHTVRFLVGQDGTVRASGTQVQFNFAVSLPEAPTLQSAIIEVRGVSYNSSGSQTIDLELRRNNSGYSDPGGAYVASGAGYTIGTSPNPKPFKILFDAKNPTATPTSCANCQDMTDQTASGTYYYSFYAMGTATGGSYSIFSAQLILTYDASSSSSQSLKTQQQLITQETSSYLSGAAVQRDFTVTIAETNPVLKSVYLEVSGVARGSGSSNTIGVSVVDPASSPASYTNYTVDMKSSGTYNVPFRVLYDASSAIVSGHYPGSHTYTLYLKGTGFTTYLWGARLISTYQYDTGAAGGLPVSGILESSTYDTAVTNGAAWNSLLWKGTTNGGKVRLQFASSNAIGGPWTASDFKGPDCSSATSYEPAANTPVAIGCAATHNNKRYARYKITLCSNDCVLVGGFNPQVNDVVVNWSP